MNQPEEALSQLRTRALGLLARREHSRWELRQKLASAGDSETLTELLDELEEQGLQSDSRYAEARTRSSVRRGQGPVRIAQELRSRAVEEELIQQALKAEGIDWHALALEVVCKRFGASAPDSLKDCARRQRFLARRGFSAEQVAQALRALEGR